MTTTPLPRRLTWVHYLLSIVALANIALLAALAANHLAFPLNLEAMESTVLEHVGRALNGQPIYIEPSAQFTPLAYNPLYYYLCAFFAKFLGLSLTTLRQVTILGTIGCGWLIYRITVRETRSNWWGWMALGLFAASYQALDSYYDVGHRDTWLVFLILAGCYLIGYSDSRLRDAMGVLLLVAAFWMKQQGAVFVAGGVAYLAWRDVRGGARVYRSWPAAAVALVFGAGLYLLLPTRWIGPDFHYFTWALPHRWAEMTRSEIRVLAELIARSFAVPVALAGAGLQMSLERGRPMSVWIFFLPVAFLSAALATLTPGSNLNVFMPFGIWLILAAMITLPRLAREIEWLERVRFPAIALALSFAALAYNPVPLIVHETQADRAYLDLCGYIDGFDGPVYTPWIGKVPGEIAAASKRQPAASHWVPLDDMMRGPASSASDLDHIKRILSPDLNQPRTYILDNTRLETDPVLSFLSNSYVLEQDLGDRFRALDCLPRRYSGLWPRYLYRYDPQAALRLSAERLVP